jgi:hypothetical protein
MLGRTPRGPRRALLVALVLVAAGCNEPETGIVELAWEFVDRDGDKIYPGGLFETSSRDSCDLPARAGSDTMTYDLGVRLEICDTGCSAGCEDPDCLVVPAQRYDCKTFRGNHPAVPASDTPYRFTVRAVLEIDQTGTTCIGPEPTCVAVPGPRDRRVEGGLVTDLQVYQIVVDFDGDVPGDREGGSLDLEACGCA